MLEQLKRPFKKVYGKVRSYVSRFVGPVKDSASKLFALVPGFKSFAGSEDLGEEADGSQYQRQHQKQRDPPDDPPFLPSRRPLARDRRGVRAARRMPRIPPPGRPPCRPART